jgi:hypothetical protein
LTRFCRVKRVVGSTRQVSWLTPGFSFPCFFFNPTQLQPRIGQLPDRPIESGFKTMNTTNKIILFLKNIYNHVYHVGLVCILQDYFAKYEIFHRTNGDSPVQPQMSEFIKITIIIVYKFQKTIFISFSKIK